MQFETGPWYKQHGGEPFFPEIPVVFATGLAHRAIGRYDRWSHGARAPTGHRQLSLYELFPGCFMILYGVPLSPFVRKTLFMLYELDCEFDQKMTVPQDNYPAFRTVSPLGRIPALTDGDFSITDSSAICHYLATRQSSALMGHGEPQTLARVIAWDKYADKDLAPAAFGPLFECVIKPVRLGKSTDEAIVAIAIKEKLPPVFDHLQAGIDRSEGDWLLGARFSYADIALGAHMSSLVLANVPVDTARWPALAHWLERLHSRPAFARLCEQARSFRMP
ncbi:MAG: glutathione S-transferase N-terminal domain-containing protein [Salinisphaera sp.]|nr:glutathione S-transferase N-terminal domain-containing protein [Salinisphaera sp.]